MKRIWNSLYGRISLLYLGLSFALCLACAWVTVGHFRTFMGAVNQRLDRQLAADLVPRIQAAASDGRYDRAVKRVGATIEELRPAVQLYVLDASGRVRASSVEDPYLRRQRIDVAPMEAFVAGATAPVRGPDPASNTDRKVFSAAPIEGPDGQTGYLYVILNGCSADAIASTFKQTYVWRTFASSLLLALGFTTVVGLVLFWVLTRRFRSLTDVVQRFKEGDYDERADASRDDEIGQLGQAFNEMADTIAAQVEALRRTDEERRRLVAQVSHDFRTPLTSIRGHVDRLLDTGAAATGDGAGPADDGAGWTDKAAPRGDGAPPPADDQWTHRLKTIRRNAERLDALSERLHELSRLDAQTPEMERDPFSIAELVHDLVVKFRPAAERHELALHADIAPDAPTVVGDIRAVERLLSNLIENAIENTPPGGTVAVRLQEAESGVEVAVVDTGRGIPADEVPLVTQRFYRVEERSEGADEGSGLGLAIASEIAEVHGDELRIESDVDEGTRVAVQLPREDPS
jgi:signal transduction histidine kinase